MPLACVRYSTKHAAEWSEGQAPKAARRDTPTDRSRAIDLSCAVRGVPWYIVVGRAVSRRRSATHSRESAPTIF
jgi:hypothetical protein